MTSEVADAYMASMVDPRDALFAELVRGASRAAALVEAPTVPEARLGLDQVGLPKHIVLQLFRRPLGLERTAIDELDHQAWQAIESAMASKLVMLRRLPSLYPDSILALRPVWSDVEALQLHPLMFRALSGEEVGERMAVELPWQAEAQAELRRSMTMQAHPFRAVDGRPRLSLTGEAVLGLYEFTRDIEDPNGEEVRVGRRMYRAQEICNAYHRGAMVPSRRVCVQFESRGEPVESTCGRVVLYWEGIPRALPFELVNCELQAWNLDPLIRTCFERCPILRAQEMVAYLYDVGLREVERLGSSLGSSDIQVPPEKTNIVQEARGEVARIQAQYDQGLIMASELRHKCIDIWARHAASTGWTLSDADQSSVFGRMMRSGAAPCYPQWQKICGFWGLYADASGEIWHTADTDNLKEGLHSLEYFKSCHGVRRAETSAYFNQVAEVKLNARLHEVLSSLPISGDDCGTTQAWEFRVQHKTFQTGPRLADMARGRVLQTQLLDPETGALLLAEDTLIGHEAHQIILKAPVPALSCRTPVHCQSPAGVCARCFGVDPRTGCLAEVGLAVGMVVAQTLSQTCRSLRAAPAYDTVVSCPYGLVHGQLAADLEGRLEFEGCDFDGDDGDTVKSTNVRVSIIDAKGQRRRSFHLRRGARVDPEARDKGYIHRGEVVAMLHPSESIYAEYSGVVRWRNIVSGQNLFTEVDPLTGHAQQVVRRVGQATTNPPRLMLRKAKAGPGQAYCVYDLVSGTEIYVEDGSFVKAGELLARTVPGERYEHSSRSGALPELLELLKGEDDKNDRLMALYDGEVLYVHEDDGHCYMRLRNLRGRCETLRSPSCCPPLLRRGDCFVAGDMLFDGPARPGDVLRIFGRHACVELMFQRLEGILRPNGVVVPDAYLELLIVALLERLHPSAGSHDSISS